MEPGRKQITTYVTPSGRDFFQEWMRELKDRKGRAIIYNRIDRLAAGNPGNYRHLTDGMNELKIDFGPGYRVYYAEDGKTLVILLCGGDKSTQHKDIARAKECWAEYRS